MLTHIMNYYQADVIVNSAVPELNLSRGRASKALLDAAGETIQSECNTWYPSGIKSGDVAITGSGNLKCQSIFHVTLPKWTNQGDEQVGWSFFLSFSFFFALSFAPYVKSEDKL